MDVRVECLDDGHALVEELRSMNIGDYIDTTKELLAFAHATGNDDLAAKAVAASEFVGCKVVDAMRGCDDGAIEALAFRILAIDLMLTAESMVDEAAFQAEIEDIEEGTCK